MPLNQVKNGGKRYRSDLNIWLIQMPDNADKDLMVRLLNTTRISYNTNVFAFTLIEEDNLIQVWDVYNLETKTGAVLKKFGLWNPWNGLQILEPDIWSRRASLEGSHINITAVYDPPAVTHITDNCSTKDCFKGMYPNLLNALCKKMNFTYTVHMADSWGSFVNGTWTGMIGEVQSGMADIAVADLTVTKARTTAVGFLPSLNEVNEKIFIKRPEDSLSLHAYMVQFSSFSSQRSPFSFRFPVFSFQFSDFRFQFSYSSFKL